MSQFPSFNAAGPLAGWKLVPVVLSPPPITRGETRRRLYWAFYRASASPLLPSSSLQLYILNIETLSPQFLPWTDINHSGSTARLFSLLTGRPSPPRVAQKETTQAGYYGASQRTPATTTTSRTTARILQQHKTLLSIILLFF